MSEEQEAPRDGNVGAPETYPTPPAPETAPAMDGKEIEEGKAFAVLSYALSFFGIPFFLVPLVMRNNAFALYHAKQCLLLWLGGIAVVAVTLLLSVICIGLILGPVLGVLLLVLCILGLINAIKGIAAPIPVVGKWGEDWFKGLTKV